MGLVGRCRVKTLDDLAAATQARDPRHDQAERLIRERDEARQQLEAATERADWFRLRWANAAGCTVEEAEHAYKRNA